MTEIPVGWHQDPNDARQERWWDGQQWSPDQVRPLQPGLGTQSADGFPPPGAHQGYPQTAPNPVQGAQFAPPSGNNSQNVLYASIAGGFVLLLLVGSVAFFAGRSSGGGSTEAGGSGNEASAAEDRDPVSPAARENEGDASADVTGCTVVSEDRFTIEVTNSSDVLSDFSGRVALLDDSGARVDDDSFVVEAIRPGESAVEPNFMLSEAAVATCEVLEVDRSSLTVDQALIDQVSGCEIKVERFSEKVQLSVTNPSDATLDYRVAYALVDAEGIRRAGGTVRIDSVRPNEPTTDEDSIYSLEDQELAGLTCQVVYVETDS